MKTTGEILLETADVRVRVMTLQAGEATPRHQHSEVTDHMVGLEGSIRVELEQPEETIPLDPGRRCTVRPGRAHRVVNTDPKRPASYLLAQGVGRYDFITDPSAQ